MKFHAARRVAYAFITSGIVWTIIDLLGHRAPNMFVALFWPVSLYVVYELINGKFMVTHKTVDLGYYLVAGLASVAIFGPFAESGFTTLDWLVFHVLSAALVICVPKIAPVPNTTEVHAYKTVRALKSLREFEEYRLQFLILGKSITRAKGAEVDAEWGEDITEVKATLAEIDNQIADAKQAIASNDHADLDEIWERIGGSSR